MSNTTKPNVTSNLPLPERVEPQPMRFAFQHRLNCECGCRTAQ